MNKQKQCRIVCIALVILLFVLFCRHISVRRYAKTLENYAQINLASWIEQQNIELDILNQRLSKAESDEVIIGLLDQWFTSVPPCAEAGLLSQNLRKLYDRNRNGSIASVASVDQIIRNNQDYSEILQWAYDELDLENQPSSLSLKFKPLYADSTFTKSLIEKLNAFNAE